MRRLCAANVASCVYYRGIDDDDVGISLLPMIVLDTAGFALLLPAFFASNLFLLEGVDSE